MPASYCRPPHLPLLPCGIPGNCCPSQPSRRALRNRRSSSKTKQNQAKAAPVRYTLFIYVRCICIRNVSKTLWNSCAGLDPRTQRTSHWSESIWNARSVCMCWYNLVCILNGSTIFIISQLFLPFVAYSVVSKDWSGRPLNSIKKSSAMRPVASIELHEFLSHFALNELSRTK